MFKTCIYIKDTLALRTRLRKIKKYFALHSQLHRRNITMLVLFNGHFIFDVNFRRTDFIISLK